MSAPSIRRRLLVLLLGTVSLLWLIAAVWSYLDALHEVDEIFDAQLAQSGRLVLTQLAHEIGEGEEEGEELWLEGGPGHPYERKLSFQLWSRDGRLLYRSSSHAPRTPLSDGRSGFSDNRIDGRRWRVFTLWDGKHELQIQIGQRYDVRRELARAVAAHQLLPSIFTLPLLAVLIWLAVGRGLAPLRPIQAEVTRRTPDRLDAIELEGIPLEIQPLVESLNALLERLNQALELERRFTADAAHELRTPLAGLRTQAQVAIRARDESERKRALDQVIEGVDRMTHLVQQMLTLARLDPSAPLEVRSTVDLQVETAAVLAELAPAALARDIDLSLIESPPVPVGGHTTLLRVLIRNLVDNAIRYTPPGGAVQVRLDATPAQAVLEVVDTGPGIPEAERTRAFDRFFRIPGSAERGSGLGLAIVRQIAGIHGAKIELADGDGGRGLRVRVILPRGSEARGVVSS